MAQLARPDSDVAKNAGTWLNQAGTALSPGGTQAWPLLDETPANDATDYTEASTAGSTSYYEVGLANVTDPTSSAGHVLRARHQKNAAQTNGQLVGGTYQLYQGSTLIATLTVAPGLGNSWQTDSYTLTGTEADAITDYTNLRIRWYKTDDATATARRLRTTQIEFEVPDPPALGTISNTDTQEYAGGLGAEPNGSTYAATTLGAASNTASYPP